MNEIPIAEERIKIVKQYELGKEAFDFDPNTARTRIKKIKTEKFEKTITDEIINNHAIYDSETFFNDLVTRTLHLFTMFKD